MDYRNCDMPTSVVLHSKDLLLRVGLHWLAFGRARHQRRIADMAALNLEKMSVKELQELIARAEAAIAKKAKEERKAALKEAREAAAKWGFDLDDLVKGADKSDGRKSGKRQLTPKFRHPENPGAPRRRGPPVEEGSTQTVVGLVW